MYKNKNNPITREELHILDNEKYNHWTREVQLVIIGSRRKPKKNKCRKNPLIREEVQILVDKKYNHSTRAVHLVNKGSTRKPTKSKCGKNKIIPSSTRKFKYLAVRSTTIRHYQYNHLV
jgi:hypothetical protein